MAELPEMNQWLKENRLQKKFGAYFAENDVIIADLLKYNEDEMEQLMKELRIDKLVYKKRFRDAVRDLQFKHNKTKRDHKFTASQIYRVIVSSKEEALIQMLTAKTAEIDVAMQRNTEITSALLEETQKRDAEIEGVFAAFRQRLGEQEKVLRNKVNEESVSQLKELKAQRRMLEAYQQAISMATKEQKMLILDPNIDSIEREFKIGQITNDTIDSIDANRVEAEVSSIEFVVDESAVNEFISSIGIVTRQPGPPTIEIPERRPNSITIQLVCSYKTSALRHWIRYRQCSHYRGGHCDDNNGVDDDDDDDDDGVDEDDEKLEWTELDLEERTDKVLIQGLRRGTKYEICGRYQLLDTLVWSKLSHCVEIETPHFPVFEWDPKRKPKKIVLSNHNLTASSPNSGWYSFVAKNELSASSMATVEWEVTIKKRPSNDAYLALMIGYMESVRVDSFKENVNLGRDKHECGLYVGGTNPFQKFAAKTFTKYDEKWKSNMINNGDRISLLFDFNLSKCTIYFNDKIIGLLTEQLPDNVYPAMSVAYEHEFETTRWRIFGK